MNTTGNNIKYVVKLETKERELLEKMISSGVSAAVKITRARILLKADQSTGQHWLKDREIAQALDVCMETVHRARMRFVEHGLEAALNNKRQPERPQKRRLDGEGEAHLIALACSRAPEDRARWTVRLLADKMVELYHFESLSKDTVQRLLKKTSLSLGSRNSGAFRRKTQSNSSTKWKMS